MIIALWVAIGLLALINVAVSLMKLIRPNIVVALLVVVVAACAFAGF